MRIVDVRGQLCPAPLIATKRALKETAEGESFQLITDSRISFNNVSRFLRDNNTPFTMTEAGGAWTLTISRGPAELAHTVAEDYCTDTIAHFNKGNFIVVISSDRMGEGDRELGELLMANFIKAIKDLDKLPRKIIFYNRGVTLAARLSPLSEHIADLGRMGVEILLCATCVNHYGLAESIDTGTLSNMYTIAEEMASAGNIVRP